ncbi:MAG: twin-arginine translocase TatA/TatE family subunit [Candidatus Eremiobacteraeota bacterium]|nr:twin-arginine translocase TatA/TatE family subunit [Candidatus Eremiobacteraeota bacterium]
MLSPSDTAIVFILALLLFGPDQLPKIARQLGEAMRHIQTTTHTFMQEMERAADTSEFSAASYPTEWEAPPALAEPPSDPNTPLPLTEFAETTLDKDPPPSAA